MLKLIRAFLTAGVLEGGLVNAVDEGTPQGGPMSPLLSNIVFDELDRELEQRGLRLVRDERYAIHHDEDQARGERLQERGGAGGGAEVSGRPDESRNGGLRPRRSGGSRSECGH